MINVWSDRYVSPDYTMYICINTSHDTPLIHLCFHVCVQNIFNYNKKYKIQPFLLCYLIMEFNHGSPFLFLCNWIIIMW
jgi:hypothetical protein